MTKSINVHITGVDGETSVQYHGPSIEAAQKFLKDNDHEGSSVSITIHAMGESAYDLLGMVK